MSELIGEPVNTGAPDEGGDDVWNAAAEQTLPAGRQIGEPKILFTKIEDETVERQVAQLGEKAVDSSQESNPEITIDDFMKGEAENSKGHQCREGEEVQEAVEVDR